MKDMFKGMIREEDGLIIAGIALAAIAAIWLLGPTLSTMFTNINTKLT